MTDFAGSAIGQLMGSFLQSSSTATGFVACTSTIVTSAAPDSIAAVASAEDRACKVTKAASFASQITGAPPTCQVTEAAPFACQTAAAARARKVSEAASFTTISSKAGCHKRGSDKEATAPQSSPQPAAVTSNAADRSFLCPAAQWPADDGRARWRCTTQDCSGVLIRSDHQTRTNTTRDKRKENDNDDSQLSAAFLRVRADRAPLIRRQQ